MTQAEDSKPEDCEVLEDNVISVWMMMKSCGKDFPNQSPPARGTQTPPLTAECRWPTRIWIRQEYPQRDGEKEREETTGYRGGSFVVFVAQSLAFTHSLTHWWLVHGPMYSARPASLLLTISLIDSYPTNIPFDTLLCFHLKIGSTFIWFLQKNSAERRRGQQTPCWRNLCLFFISPN